MNLKNEELVPLADMLIASFERDQAQIAAENSFYSTTLLNEFKQQTEEVRELEKADTLLVKQKGVTRALYLLSDDLYQPLKIFNIVVGKAKLGTNLPIEIIADLKKRNIEGGLTKIKALIQVVSTNNALLTSKAMKPNFPALLDASFASLTEKSNLQTKIITDRKLLTENNEGSYTTLYDEYIVDICQIGKALFRGQAKVNEYTISKMLKLLHVTRVNKQ